MKNSSRLALQTAIITAVIGPLALAVIQYFLKPQVVEQTKESISTVTVSDERIRELQSSLLFIKNPRRGIATGFFLSRYPRYVVTTESLFSEVNEGAAVIRFKGSADEITDAGQVIVIDKGTALALVDMGKKLDIAFSVSPTKSGVKVFDKVFTIGYAQSGFPVLREGRIATLDYSLAGAQGQFISADLPWEVGMAGSPVFDKNGKVIGVLSAGLRGSSLGFITPITRLLQLLEKTASRQ